MCSDLMLEIKSFVSFKNESSFLDEGTFQGGKGGEEGEFSFPKFLGGGGGLLIKGGGWGLTDLEFFFWRGAVNISGWS